MAVTPTISVRALAKLFAWAGATGLPRDDLAAGAGVDPACLGDVDARVPVAALHRLWELAVSRSGCRHAPLDVARTYTPGDYALMGFLCQHSATVADALASLTRFSRLWTDEPRFQVEGPRITLVYRASFPPSLGLACASEASLAEIVHAARQMATPARLGVTSVSFAHPAPADRRPFDEHFGVPVRFDAPACELVLAADFLAEPLARAEPELAAFLQGLAAAALARHREQDTLRARVMALLADRLRDGIPSAELLARALGMSERTLRRRLDAEGTTLRELVDETRGELAREYIRDRRLPLAEVAYLLGFSEVSAFHRAFKRWTGETPAGFRARHG